MLFLVRNFNLPTIDCRLPTAFLPTKKNLIKPENLRFILNQIVKLYS